MWDFMLSWLTPASIFVFVNLTIGTIALSHCFNRSYPQQQPQYHQFGDVSAHRLVRRPSLLDRVRSFDFSHYNFQPADHIEFNQVPENLTGSVRTPSLMERLRSIDLSHYNFQQLYPEPQHLTVHPTPDNLNPTGIVRTPSLLDRVRSFNFSQYNSPEPDPEPEHVTAEYSSTDRPTGMVRTPSLLARLKSMDFSSLYRSDPESTDLHPTEANNPNPTHDRVVHRSKSDRGHEDWESRPEKVIKKSASEGRRVVEKTMSFGDDEEVDAKADDFINRFKQQLKLQRLDSLMRYRDMLKRN